MILITQRINYYSSPAIRINAQKAFDMAGIKLEDISYFDFYSCFPSAVQIACEELGLDQDQFRYDVNQDRRVKSNKLDAKLDYYNILNSKSSSTPFGITE